MPLKTDKLALDCPFLDSRCKLLPCQIEMIFHYRKEGYSNNKLAAKFSVSKRTIQFILDPEKLVENKKRRAERGGSKIYYVKEEHVDSMKRHRHKKYQLLKHTLKDANNQ
jgi:hypothetical protein